MGIIERISRVCAIWADHHDPDAWRAYQGVARLILAEMGTPTEEMLIAGAGHNTGDVWYLMLQAALAEPDQTKPE